MSSLHRGSIVFAALRGAVGSEIRKSRPWLVVSPDELNEVSMTVTVVPLTSGDFPYPFRIPCTWRGVKGHVVVDQPRTIDRRRIERIAGELPEATVRAVLSKLREMFEE